MTNRTIMNRSPNNHKFSGDFVTRVVTIFIIYKITRKLTTPGSMTNNKNKNALPTGNNPKDNIKKIIVLTVKTIHKAVLVFLEISHENPWIKPMAIPPNVPVITPNLGME